MKLNLLPTHVSKEKGARTGIVLGALVAVVGAAAAVGMIVMSKARREQAYQTMFEKEPQAAAVVALSKQADAVIEKARPIILNINLAEAMNKHNTVYPDAYDEIRRFIPAFFRVTSMALSPGSAESTTVNITGVLQTQQQYADLMLALLRIPGAASVSRDGYQIVSPSVPSLSTIDQIGRPLKPGDSPIPDNPEERLNYYIAQGQLTGFENTGGFGGEPGQRGAMPDWSEIAVSVVVPKNVMTPNPRATLAGGGGAGGTGGGAGAPNTPPRVNFRGTGPKAGG